MSSPIALWVSPVSNLAGVARHIIDVARVGLPGWRLVVTAPEGPLLDRLRALGCPVVPLDLEQPTPRAVHDLRHTVTKLAPQVVHSHLAKADFLVTMATAGLPATLVSTEHHIPEDPLTFHGTRAKALARQVAHHVRIRRFSQLIAVSESTKRDMLRFWHPSAPVTVVLNGVDRLEQAQARERGLRVLSLSRLSPEKNVEMTLGAFAKVVETHPDATLTVAGTGDDAEALQQLAHGLGLDRAADFVGFVDPVEAMATHDVLVQPSKADNLSYSLLDAVAAGMGVVASAIGGNGEIVPSRCLVALGDHEAMARAIIRQGTVPSERPLLPASIPTTRQMARQIVAVYAKAGHGPTAAALGLDAAPSDDTPAVSVTIAYYRSGATLGAQLDCLVDQVDPPPFEVIIADNEGSPELALIVAGYRDRLNIRVIDATDAPGESHARNVAVLSARADIIGLCDADDLVCATWVRALHSATRENDVLATGPLRLDRVNPEYAWRTFTGTPSDVEVDGPVLLELIPALGHETYAVGCNLGVRRATYLASGGIDEGLLGGSEDVDFSLRLKKSGVPIAFRRDMVVDYRLPTSAVEVFKHRRRCQLSRLNLWKKSVDFRRPVRGMSLRWVVDATSQLPGRAWQARTMTGSEQCREAALAGAVLRNLEGQIRHRVLDRTL